MTNFFDIINRCASASGNGSKKVIMAALAESDDTARKLITLAQNPYIVFGVKKYARPQCVDGYAVGEFEEAMRLFLEVCDLLSTRELTGDAAREAVTSSLGQFTREHSDLLARVLGKDLKAGFSADTVNKIFPDLVPTFPVMLADKCDSAEEFERYVTFPCMAEVKLDGQRTIALVKDGVVHYFARSGKLSEHLEGLFDEELLALSQHVGRPIIADGEVFGKNFIETMNAKKEGNEAAQQALNFHVFFLMSFDDWLRRSTDITQEQVRLNIEAGLAAIGATKLRSVGGRIVTDYQDMMNYCNTVIDEYGQEGLILKDLKSSYTWDRSMSWCKVKRMYDVDGCIVDTYAGTAGSRLENSLGGIIVEGTDERGRKFSTRVGSGFSDEQRAEIWSQQDKYIGQTATIKFQEISRAKDSELYSLRFPVFCHFRDDK